MQLTNLSTFWLQNTTFLLQYDNVKVIKYDNNNLNSKDLNQQTSYIDKPTFRHQVIKQLLKVSVQYLDECNTGKINLKEASNQP